MRPVELFGAILGASWAVFGRLEDDMARAPKSFNSQGKCMICTSWGAVGGALEDFLGRLGGLLAVLEPSSASWS
eukprot:7676001-Pyramimonas_sp.AAC.1